MRYFISLRLITLNWARIFPSIHNFSAFDYALAKNLVQSGNFSLCRTYPFLFSSSRVTGQEGGKGRGQRILRSHETRLHVCPPTSNSGCERPLSRSLSFISSFPFFLTSSLSSFSSSLPSLLFVRARARPVYSRARNQFTRDDLRRDRWTERDLDLRHTHAHTQ